MILVTNDDGIDSPGLAVLEFVAHQLAGHGKFFSQNVVVIAPDGPRSGCSNSLKLLDLSFEKREINRWATNGFPTDCVMLARQAFRKVPDLVLSGVNNGPNAGVSSVYSGTCGAARHAALEGAIAVALSLDVDYTKPPHEKDFVNLEPLVEKVLRMILRQANPDQYFYNVNLPEPLHTRFQGIKQVDNAAEEVELLRGGFATIARLPALLYGKIDL